MSNLVFIEDGHRYLLHGVEIPGVTRVIDWAYQAYAHIHPSVLKAAQERGTAVHKATDLYDAGTLDLATLDDSIAGYLEGWVKLQTEIGLHFFNRERMAWSEKYGYACRFDCHGIGKRLVVARNALFEIKTILQPTDLTGLQLAAQEVAAKERGILDSGPCDRYAVHLRPNGTYRLRVYKSKTDFSKFKKALYDYRKANHKPMEQT